MWKVLVADDEPKIRRGLKNSLDWNEFNMEIVGEAEDGEMAFEVARDLQPDVLLVDICMPFLNGLQLIEKLNKVLDRCIIIIITGHDEFTYAQQAVKLKVFDYLLKPVSKEQLVAVLNKANEELKILHSKHKYISWAAQQMDRNLPAIKECFLKDLLHGQLSELEIQEQSRFLNLDFPADSGMIIIKVVERCNRGEIRAEWDKPLLLFALQNVIEDILQEWQPNTVFRDNKENIIAITPIKNIVEWLELGVILETRSEKYLKQMVITTQGKFEDVKMGIPAVYEELIMEINAKGNCTPIVLLSKKYIDAYYYKEDLSLQDLADQIQISPTYLSRLLKQEIGASFIDYLTQVRVRKAIQIMSDHTVKIYEVAERVGYSSQHYFSTAFKKVLGVSPAEYRKRGKCS